VAGVVLEIVLIGLRMHAVIAHLLVNKNEYALEVSIGS